MLKVSEGVIPRPSRRSFSTLWVKLEPELICPYCKNPVQEVSLAWVFRHEIERRPPLCLAWKPAKCGPEFSCRPCDCVLNRHKAPLAYRELLLRTLAQGHDFERALYDKYAVLIGNDPVPVPVPAETPETGRLRNILARVRRELDDVDSPHPDVKCDNIRALLDNEHV
jgi:hypothetical protein